MVKPSTISFLKSLKKNNNKDWFDKNKDKYLDAKSNVEDLVNALIRDFTKFEKGLAGLSAKDCVAALWAGEWAP